MKAYLSSSKIYSKIILKRSFKASRKLQSITSFSLMFREKKAVLYLREKNKLTLIDSFSFHVTIFNRIIKITTSQFYLDSLQEDSFKSKNKYDGIALALPLTCPVTDLGKCSLTTLGLAFVTCEIRRVPEFLLRSF